MKPVIDHIQITVKDIEKVQIFYDKLMPILGFDISEKVSAIIKEHDLYVIEYLHENMGFSICSPRKSFMNDTVHRRKPSAFHHLAFRVNSRKEVDELHEKIRNIGANIVHSPRIFLEHGPNYYAMFFKDLDGIKYEIVFNNYPPL